MTRVLWVTAAAACAVLGLGTVGHAVPAHAAAGASGRHSHAHLVFTMRSKLISESSALALSSTHPGLVYTTNDSGHAPTVFVLNDRNGQLVGRTRLTGLHAIDIEALCASSDGSLYVGDIGDNNGTRPHIRIYRLPQPGVGHHKVTPRKLILSYPHGKHDAESMLYDTTTGRVYVISKEVFGKVYASPPQVFNGRRATLHVVAPAPPVATDAAWLDHGRYVVIRGYSSAVVDAFPSFHQLAHFPLPPQRQGESVTEAPGGGAIWVGSEGHHPKVKSVPLPNLAPPSTPPTTTGSNEAGGATSAPDPGKPGTTAKTTANIVLYAGGTALVLLILAVVVAWVRDRRRLHSST